MTDMTKQTEAISTERALKLALKGAANYIDALGGDSRKYRQALASEAIEQPAQQEPVAWIEHNDETSEPCPSCGKPLQSASGGGVVCSGRCGYWFCF